MGFKKQRDTWFDSRHVMVDEDSGLHYPDLRKI